MQENESSGDRPGAQPPEVQRLPAVEPVGVDQMEKANQAQELDSGTAALRKVELDAVKKRRERYCLPSATDDNGFGLALSGGGIRSATFALGVLQAMAARDLLKHVDFMSTVSGGGYIGSSLQWWWSGWSGRTFGVRPDRPNPDPVTGRAAVPPKERFPYGTDDPSQWRDRPGQNPGPKLLRNLKERANYLTPGGGINLMSLLAVVLRSLILSLFFWVPLLTVLLGILHVTGGYDFALQIAGGAAGIFVLAALVYSLVTGSRGLRHSGYRVRRQTERFAGLILTVALGLGLVGAVEPVHDRLVHGARQDGVDTGGERPLASGAVDTTTEGNASVADSEAVAGEDARREAGIDELISGTVAALGGLAGGLYIFFRTVRGVVTRIRKVATVTTKVIAALAAGLIIYGVLLFCHGLAVIFVANHQSALGLGLAAFFLFVSVWVNINHISAHRMYRDRLMEAFMPSFDEAEKGKSHAAPAEADGMGMDAVKVSNGPFPIINTNLLLVDSIERRRRLRGGDNFILTPRYCGSNATGWVDCREFMEGRMTLPTAMAISGAAANPNTGVGGVGLTRNRLISALMALMGLRLGYWVPALNAHWLKFLPNHVWPGVSAVLPRGHREDSWFLELSDGGHFENLGIYELVRRRVRLIIVCDGAQDPDFAFEDLQRTQRRIEADFGACLLGQVNALERLVPKKTEQRFPEADLKLADAGHSLGTITFADGSPATIVYLKTTLIKGLPLALLGYRGANPTFPDESTSDQFFDEEQFEAYRELGFIIAEQMMADPEVRPHLNRATGGDDNWEPPPIEPAPPAEAHQPA